MSKINKTISSFAGPLLLLLFIIYSGSITMFYHTHELHGALLTHSHPYKLPLGKGTGTDHSHSASQFFLLLYLCQTPMADSVVDFVNIPDLIYVLEDIVVTPFSEPFSENVITVESLRAPPFS
jgi:hypothetical protein